MKDLSIDDVVQAMKNGATIEETVDMMDRVKGPVWICQGCGAENSIGDYGKCRIVSCYTQNVLGG